MWYMLILNLICKNLIMLTSRLLYILLSASWSKTWNATNFDNLDWHILYLLYAVWGIHFFLRHATLAAVIWDFVYKAYDLSLLTGGSKGKDVGDDWPRIKSCIFVSALCQLWSIRRSYLSFTRVHRIICFDGKVFTIMDWIYYCCH
jgi:hypothetical protein